MPRTCTICAHPERAGIDAALIETTPLRTIAGHYDVSKTALARHRNEHLPAQLAQAHAAAEVAQADDLLGQVRALHAKALAILGSAETAGDLRTALGGIREARSCLELEAKIRGEIDDRPHVNILLAPDWLRTRSALLAALAPFIEARIAAADALLALEASPAQAEGERAS